MQDNTVIARVEEQDCCGCGACFNKCPFDAIVMQENEEGFLHPVIDENKCRNCGLCLNACPSINAFYDNSSEPVCYAAMTDDELRMKSSSGGVFTLLAEAVLRKGGQVCGAAYDDNWNVHHIPVDNSEDLQKLRSSKYVQSSTDDCYQKIEVLLKKGTPVLFSGCPCQVAGLYSYLGKKYDELYTMDLICHGVPSRKLWREYLKENFGDKKIVNINLRDKSVFGWSMGMSITFMDSTTIQKTTSQDPYLKAFQVSMTLNKHCGKCFYSRLPRQGDISAGDWWGIDNFAKGLNDGKGTSQILINNKKGEKLYSRVSEKFKINYDIGLDTTLQSINKTIYTHFPTHKNRERFYKEIKNSTTNNTMNKIITDCVNDHYDILLITTFYAKNYGAIFVAYAVNRILTNLGYSVLMLQKTSFVWEGYPVSGTIPSNFASSHYNISKVFHDNEDLVSLNRHCDIFVVGSDQLFNPNVFQEHTFKFLEFVESGKNKIAFGTSFGSDISHYSEDAIKKMNFLLRRFNGLALRDSGAEICREEFNIHAESIIAPTLLLPAETYEELANQAEDKSLPQKPYVLTYLLDINEKNNTC